MKSVIGLPSGKLQGPTYEFLSERGIKLPNYSPELGIRNYRIETADAVFVIDTSRDLPKRVATGDIDAAIAGESEIQEFLGERETARINGVRNIFYEASEAFYVRPLPPYLTWKLVVLVREDARDRTFHDMLKRLNARDMRTPLISWTEYPYSERRLLQELIPDMTVGMYPYSDGDVVIMASSGATESKLRAGDSSFGLEVVSSGKTAELNGLRPFSETEKTYRSVVMQGIGTNNGFVKELVKQLEE